MHRSTPCQAIHPRQAVAFFLALICTLALPAWADSQAGDKNSKPTVLITGANRGLGLEFARQYTNAGWTVIATARNPAKAVELNALDVKVLPLDVTQRDSIANLASSLEGLALDMLINNAGIFPKANSLAEIDGDNYERTLRVNTLGPALVTQALIEHLRRGQMKRIINITSQLASIENSGGRFYGYRESKAALNMFTKTLSAELGPEGFIALALHPGWVRTDMGGPTASLSPTESVTAMRAVIDNLTAKDNGTYHAFNGEQVPW